MNWSKSGLIYECPGVHPKLLTHAANPLPVHIEKDVYRIFFSSRDRNNRSSVCAVDMDIVSGEVVNEEVAPTFLHGNKGSFFRDGVSIGNSYEADGNHYMLFMGWSAPANGHWYGQIGRLIVGDNFSLKLDPTQPFLPLDEEDPISLSYPWVIYENGRYQMWYGSTISWEASNGEMLHVIKYAESTNGIDWMKKGIAVPFELGIAQAFSRPSVLVDDSGMYHMWYSYRSGNGDPYRIGYSQSKDGIEWKRRHHLFSLQCSRHGWDSEMVEYPFVLERDGDIFLFYNGNGYGKSGIGLAKMNMKMLIESGQ